MSTVELVHCYVTILRTFFCSKLNLPLYDKLAPIYVKECIISRLTPLYLKTSTSVLGLPLCKITIFVFSVFTDNFHALQYYSSLSSICWRPWDVFDNNKVSPAYNNIEIDKNCVKPQDQLYRRYIRFQQTH